MKECGTCKNTKPYSEFYEKTRSVIYPESSAGFSSDCKECAKSKIYHSNRISPLKRKSNELKHSFKIDIDDYNKMFAIQHGSCAICKNHQSEMKRYMAVDHDHVTGRIRSLLCNSCNVGLGMFKDNLNNLESAVSYLKFYSELADVETNVVDFESAKKGGYSHS